MDGGTWLATLGSAPTEALTELIELLADEGMRKIVIRDIEHP